MTNLASATNRHALVVDDEALIRWSVSETLAEMGMAVQQAGDGAAALAAIANASTPFDVVVLDLRLPDVEDLTLLGKVRQLLPTARVVLMTAYGTPEIVAGARALGVIGILSKPFELGALSKLVLGPGGA